MQWCWHMPLMLVLRIVMFWNVNIVLLSICNDVSLCYWMSPVFLILWVFYKIPELIALIFVMYSSSRTMSIELSLLSFSQIIEYAPECLLLSRYIRCLIGNVNYGFSFVIKYSQMMILFRAIITRNYMVNLQQLMIVSLI